MSQLHVKCKSFACTLSLRRYSVLGCTRHVYWVSSTTHHFYQVVISIPRCLHQRLRSQVILTDPLQNPFCDILASGCLALRRPNHLRETRKTGQSERFIEAETALLPPTNLVQISRVAPQATASTVNHNHICPQMGVENSSTILDLEEVVSQGPPQLLFSTCAQWHDIIRSTLRRTLCNCVLNHALDCFWSLR